MAVSPPGGTPSGRRPPGVTLVGLLIAVADLLVVRARRAGRAPARGLATLLALVSPAGAVRGVPTYGGHLLWSSILAVNGALSVPALLRVDPGERILPGPPTGGG
jgi:hypothetical protein